MTNDKFKPLIPKTYEVKYIENKEPSKLSKLANCLGMKKVENCSYSGCPHSTDFNLEIFIEGNRRKWAKSTGVATWLPGSWETGFWTSHYESRWDLWLPNIDYARRIKPLLVNDTVYTVNLMGEHCAEDNKFCNCALEIIRKAVGHHESGYEIKEKITLNSDISKWSRYAFKTGAVIGASFINPGAAMAIGVGAFGAGQAGRAICDSDRGKAFWGTVSDMGIGSFGSGAMKGIDGFLGKLTNNSGGFCDWGKVSKASESKLIENIKKITGPVTDDAIMHVVHQTLGYGYHSECSICN